MEYLFYYLVYESFYYPLFLELISWKLRVAVVDDEAGIWIRKETAKELQDRETGS